MQEYAFSQCRGWEKKKQTVSQHKKHNKLQYLHTHMQAHTHMHTRTHTSTHIILYIEIARKSALFAVKESVTYTQKINESVKFTQLS